MSKNLELVKVVLDPQGFSFYVVDLPDDYLEEKLAFISPDTGLISRIEYQDFLFNELTLNVERIFRHIAQDTGGDYDAQLELRNRIEEAIYRVNPLLNPDGLVITRGGLIKPSSSSEGTPLDENPDWDKIVDLDINPYVFMEEYEIISVAPEDVIPAAPISDPADEAFLNKFDTVDRFWETLGITLKVRKFAKNDLPLIFGPQVSFPMELHYKVHVVQQCLEKSASVFALCDATGLTETVQIPTLAEELYQICLEVNPFLKYEEVDLDELRNNDKRTTKRRRGKQPKRRPGSGKRFTDVSKEELLALEARMNSRIIGQEEAVEKIVDTIQIASCGLRDPESPISVYLMCGTTGTGKTHTAKVLAEELCGSKDNMVRVDCSEYTQQHDVQKLIGAPPSYVGYEDGGFLTNAVQDNPFSVILFDEVEKAHNKLFDLLLQIMDDARLTDGKGNVTDFKDCIILMTSNIGVSEAEAVKSTMGFGDAGLLTDERRQDSLKQALKNRFRPEFLNRIDEVLNFRSLNKEDALKVVDLLLDKVKGYLSEKNISAEFTDRARDMVFEKGFSKKFGARPLDRAINKEIIRVLAKMILRDEIKEYSKIKIDYVKNNLVVKEAKPRIRKTTTIKS